MWLLVILFMFGQNCYAPRGVQKGEKSLTPCVPGGVGTGKDPADLTLQPWSRGHSLPVTVKAGTSLPVLLSLVALLLNLALIFSGRKEG